jgi:uncharacterized protein (DUF924 family)
MSGTPSSDDAIEPAWVTEVLHFWFDELGSLHWFADSEEIDAQIRDRFLLLHHEIGFSLKPLTTRSFPPQQGQVV